MTGKRVGLVIGNNYPDSDKELRFAVADALAMKEVLLNKDICGFDEVEESIDDTFIDARIKIEKILKNANRDDLVFIYFSGHGKKHLDNGLRLLFKDAREDYPLATSLNFDYINRCMKYPSLKSVIIVLDCCYSGAAGIKGDDLEEAFSNYSTGPGTIILTSTGLIGSPKAKEDPELKHGIFTNYLLEGLKTGGADEDEDGLIYVNDLYEYAHNRTIKRSSQSPVMKTQMEGKILIAKNRKKIKDNEYQLKSSKLLREFSIQLPPRILGESLTILRNYYYAPSPLEQVDITIYNFLELLLKGEFSVDNYIEAVQRLKGISISTPLPRNKNTGSVSKPEVTNIGNKGIYEESKKYEIPKTFTSPSTGMEFVLIPAGEFMMGSPSGEKGRFDDEDPAHKVTIGYSFYMGKYPVTQKQWKKVMGDNPSTFKGESRPVESIFWEDVQEFIKKLNKNEGASKYRLPSEAEWEYCCRASTQTRYFFGDNESKLDEYAWYDDNSGSETHPVGQKKSNKWGLYDIVGNVWEWVQDKWHHNYLVTPSDGSAWEDDYSSSHVVRGGSWSYPARRCRSADRRRNLPESCKSDIGFRLLKKL
ncbi:SUMF1/EgtB/PvdO family nonheme iron enzyme [Methanosarcina sp. DH1]|uniref:SUMF1/EgtB/PvdO family nonheme iron enzyme n=1 Tax=Methanosarcina sp. DH1 TaxID=2605695 RepID=UPI001E2C813F|nr:SUMF1/EgtB/PvdO family nonheme iron enzyme [Methanosarcina sp. DH1]MCC4768095.1 SUMF1/EgtB/PvdO family nonheme iron enzyme [Methanosarcina sp. DH1]